MPSVLTSTSTIVSSFLLERYHLNEVTPEEERAVADALAADPALMERLSALARTDKA